MEVWMTEGPRVNFVMREALFEFTSGSSVFHTSMRNKQVEIFTMVAYFLRWTLLKLFSSIPDEQSQQKVRQLGRFTRAVINTSNEVKCPLLLEFWIYNFSRRILVRVFVGSIVNIRNECLFVWVHGEWIVARNKQIVTRFVCPALRFIPHEPRKKDTHSLIQSLYLYFIKIVPFWLLNIRF